MESWSTKQFVCKSFIVSCLYYNFMWKLSGVLDSRNNKECPVLASSAAGACRPRDSCNNLLERLLSCSIRWRSKVSLVDYCVYLRVWWCARVCERGPPSARPHAAPTHVAAAPHRGPQPIAISRCQTRYPLPAARYRWTSIRALIDTCHSNWSNWKRIRPQHLRGRYRNKQSIDNQKDN